MSALDFELNQELERLKSVDLYRSLRQIESTQASCIQVAGRKITNFSSNDYLGLASDSVLVEAGKAALEKWGSGAGSSRLICGTQIPHHALEIALAQFKQTEAALVFATGYMTAVGTLQALLTTDDVIIIDKLVHACVVDAARLSGAKIRVFDHNNLADLEQKLRWAETRGQPSSQVRRQRVMIVTESIFSMDGDQAPLRGMVELKEKYHADLMVDEAHSTGLYGEQGRGLSNSMNLSRQVDIQMGTLSKALGSSGGFICGSKTLIEFLVNRARSFIFSTAPSPVVAAMSLAAVELVQSAEGQKRRDVLWQRVAQLCDGLRSLGITVAEQPSAIIPVMIGGEKEALDYGRYLYDQGFLAPAIRYPTVARGASRIRLTVSASHKESDICALLKVLSNRRP